MKSYSIYGLLIFAAVFLFSGAACSRNMEAVDNSGPCPQERNTARAPDSAYSKANPLPATPETIQAGELLYQQKAAPIACKYCHGEKGDGQGDPDFAGNPPARNFACAETMNKISDGQLFWVIKNGSPNTSMPAFSGLSEEQAWQLVRYIRQFAR